MQHKPKFTIGIIAPFPNEELIHAWEWMHEFPNANMDDTCSDNSENFIKNTRMRLTYELSWGAVVDGKVKGIICFNRFNERLGFFHGICFSKGNFERKQKQWILRSILQELFARKIEKVCATYFADNEKIDKFLKDLGAIREGYFRRHTVRNGLPIDMVQVAFFPDSVKGSEEGELLRR